MLFNEEDFTEFLESLEGSAFKKKEIKKLKKHVADIVQYLNEEMEDTIFTELENYLYEYLPEAKKQKNVISMSDEDVEASEREAAELSAYYEALDFEQENQKCGCGCEGDDEYEYLPEAEKQVKFLSLKQLKLSEIDKAKLFGDVTYKAIPVTAETKLTTGFVSWQGNEIITPGRTVFEEEKPKRFIILDSKGKPQSDFLSKKEAKEELKALQEYYDEYYDWQVVKVKIKAKKIKK